MTEFQGVSLTEAYDNRSVMAQIARLKDRVRVLEEGGSEEIEREIELINEQLTILERQVGNNGANIDLLAGRMTAVETGKADASALTDGSVTKVGTSTVGSLTSPIYLNNGTPTVCGANFLMGGVNNVGSQGVELTADSYENMGKLRLSRANLMPECDIHYRRWDGYNAATTAMWGWDIAVQVEKDNAFEMSLDVIREGISGEDLTYSRFRLVSNGSGDTESSPKVPPVLDLTCEFGDPSMICVSRLNVAHWSTDFTIWHVYARVSQTGASANRMPAIRINYVRSKEHVHFYYQPTEYHQQYEDVTYGGGTIPNVTNYMYYDWQFPAKEGGSEEWQAVATYGEAAFNDLFELVTGTQAGLVVYKAKKDILIYASYETGQPQATMTASIMKGQHVMDVSLISSLGFSSASPTGPIMYIASLPIKAAIWDGDCTYVAKLFLPKGSSSGSNAGAQSTYWPMVTVVKQNSMPFNPGSSNTLMVYVCYKE